MRERRRVVPQAQRPKVAASLGEVWSRWKNDYQFASADRLLADFRARKLDRGVTGDAQKANALVTLNGALHLVGIGVGRWNKTTEHYRTRVMKALCDLGFENEQIHLETTLSGSVGGHIVSGSFATKSQAERQSELWDGLRTKLTAFELTKIVAIMTVTPEEISDDVSE